MTCKNTRNMLSSEITNYGKLDPKKMDFCLPCALNSGCIFYFIVNDDAMLLTIRKRIC